MFFIDARGVATERLARDDHHLLSLLPMPDSVLVGAGADGRIYRASAQAHAAVLDLPERQVRAAVATPSGPAWVTSDPVRVHRSRADGPRQWTSAALDAERVLPAGLMTIPSDEGEEAARLVFLGLAELRTSIAAQLGEEGYDVSEFVELSMGMSGDYEIAIKEGATIVRVGSALFQGVM